MISTSESERIETHLLFRWKAASRMTEVGVDIPWPLIGKSETSYCLLTNLISGRLVIGMSSGTSSAWTWTVEIFSMFIWMKDLTLHLLFNGWFSLEKESSLGDGVDTWLGINKINPLNSYLSVIGKNPTQRNNQEMKGIEIKKTYESIITWNVV